MAKVLIKQGYHGGKKIGPIEFEIVRPLSMGNRGPFIMVNGDGVPGFPQRNFKVFVESAADFTVKGPDAAQFAKVGRDRVRDKLTKKVSTKTGSVFETSAVETDETDQEIKDRLAERFSIMERMATAAARGTIKGLIVSGAPGTGKSYGIEHALGRDSLFDKLAFDPGDTASRRTADDGSFKPRYKFVKGFATPSALYEQLLEYSNPREVLVFDDCDSILYDDVGLNLLKTALDTSGQRILSWLNRSTRKDALPDQFEYKGSLIFITNLDFERSIARQTKLSPHLEAMMDRCLYLDLTIHSIREKLIRIDQVCKDFKMLEHKGLSSEQQVEVLDWIHTNARRFQRLSLRKVDQLADIRISSKNWLREAEIMLLRNR